MARQLAVRLSPRWGLVEPWIEQAADEATAQGLALRVQGLPACALGRARALLQRHPTTLVSPDAPPGFLPSPIRASCLSCPGLPDCPGGSGDYIDCFGDGELRSESRPRPAPVGSLPEDPLSPPPPRAGRDPATRLRFVRRQLTRGPGGLRGDPLAGWEARGQPEQLLLRPRCPRVLADPLLDPSEEPAFERSRLLRQRILRAAQHGIPGLRLAAAGLFHHPQWLPLVQDVGRLQLKLELAGEGSRLLSLSPRELRTLKRASPWIRIPLLGPSAALHDQRAGMPGSWEDSLEACRRLQHEGLRCSLYGIARDPEDWLPFLQRWEEGALWGPIWLKPLFPLRPSPEWESHPLAAEAAAPWLAGSLRLTPAVTPWRAASPLDTQCPTDPCGAQPL